MRKKPAAGTPGRKKRPALILALLLCILVGCNQSSGDRVLVAKYLYDSKLAPERRFDIVVFKYPRGPVENGVPKNYIKRLLGLPGEVLAIFFGQLFAWHPQPGEAPPYDDVHNPHINPNDLWKIDGAMDFMHTDDPKSKALFETPGKFQIIRKTPEIMLALRRIVYDNDFPAEDLKGVLPPRWNADLTPNPPGREGGRGFGWAALQDHRQFSHPGNKGKTIDWLRYQHLLRPADAQAPPDQVKPQLITDFMGYNSFRLRDMGERTPGENWVGDLMLECQLTVDRPEGAFFMELAKGIYRFQARWDLDTGLCTLRKQGPEGKKADRWEDLGSQKTSVNKPGSYQLRLANFDARLTVWVNRELPFGDGRDYPPPEIRHKKEGEDQLTEEDLLRRRGPTGNDLEPARIGSQGAAVKVQNIRLWRDTYYTMNADSSDLGAPPGQVSWSDSSSWEPLKKLRYKTMYIQPGHYLCLGDNSTASSDSRTWGLVPERLMLGRALLVYFPLSRFGPIR